MSHPIRALTAVLSSLLLAGCAFEPSERQALASDGTLHLEEHLDAAVIEGSVVPPTLVQPIVWRFDSPDHGWRPVAAEGGRAVDLEGSDGALRLRLTEAHRQPSDPHLLEGYVFVDLPDVRFGDWSSAEITARARGMRNMGLLHNYTETDPQFASDVPFYTSGGRAALIADGTEQTYRLPLVRAGRRPVKGPWTHLGIWFNALATEESAVLDLVSVRLVTAEAAFAGKPVGVEMVTRGSVTESSGLPANRRSLFVHAPAEVSYRLTVPAAGRLDIGLGILKNDAPVTFSVTATHESESRTLLEESRSDSRQWSQRSIDLSPFEGEEIALTLGASSQKPGSVAFWAAPTVSGQRRTNRPNVILYIIDGGGADYMSAYEYPRHTTPTLERLAAEGAVFESAHSNSSWTRPSTLSFLTSLQHSTLGGLVRGRNTVPEGVQTLAEHLHRAGYQTAQFTTNSNAGSMSGLERGNDVFREAGVENWSTSSADLHDNFWAWRDAYPGEPYYVHFQPTDVHNPHVPEAPFAGLFIDAERRQLADDWTAKVEEVPESDDVRINDAIVQIGGDAGIYWPAQRDLHDECMAHQDHQIGELVERLRANGEWERTVLIVAADHSVAAGSWDYSLLMRDPVPEHVYHDDWAAPIFRPGVSRVPLIVAWPNGIGPGRRIRQPVSMIDVLPTVLDLAGLPLPDIRQGQSLVPLLRGEAGWEPRPLLFDEFEVDRETSRFRGRIEIADGRWGASLLINQDPKTAERFRRSSPLILCDLWQDPHCLESLHEERPDLVEKYTRILERQFKAHRDLGSLFDPAADSALTPEQLETLRSLGYIE